MSEETEEGFDMSRLAPVEDTSAPLVPEPDEDEVVDEEVVEAAEDVDGDELPVDEAPQSDNQHSQLMDKEVQKLQQLRATYEREIAALQDKPSERQVERVEKAKTKLDKYLDDKDVDPYQGVTDIAQEVMADRGKVEGLLQQYEADRKAADERAIRQESELAQMRFTMDFPELKGQYRSIQQKAHEALVGKLGDVAQTIDAQSYVALVNAEFVDIAKREAEAAKPKTEPEAPEPKVKDTAKKPKATNIIKSQTGTKVAPPQSDEAKAEELLSRLGPLG